MLSLKCLPKGQGPIGTLWEQRGWQAPFLYSPSILLVPAALMVFCLSSCLTKAALLKHVQHTLGNNP